MNIILLVLLIVCIIVGAFFLNKLEDDHYEKISIQESMDLTGYPIITLRNNNKKLNFLLDTGSNYSFIIPSALKLTDGIKQAAKLSISTYDGVENQGSKYLLNLEYKSDIFDADLYENPSLEVGFKEIKDCYGVQLHGIIGADFLNKYDYIIDFKELVAYSKSKKK